MESNWNQLNNILLIILLLSGPENVESIASLTENPTTLDVTWTEPAGKFDFYQVKYFDSDGREFLGSPLLDDIELQ